MRSGSVLCSPDLAKYRTCQWTQRSITILSGEQTYYKLKSSGIEIGFRQKRLTHLHLFCSPEEGYAPYGGPLLAGIKKSWTEAWVVKSLGNPSRSGGGNLKGLLGFIHRWIRYDFAAHAVRFEFFSDGSLRKVSLMTLPQ